MEKQDTITSMNETKPDFEWRPVPGYEGHYEVSSYGDVRSCPRDYDTGKITKRGKRRVYKRVGKMLSKKSKGYLKVGLSKNGEQTVINVSRIVALAFLGPPPEDAPYVLHYDDNKHNNCAKNLRYGTQKENGADRSRNKMKNLVNHPQYAEVSYMARATDKTITEISNSLGVKPSFVLSVMRDSGIEPRRYKPGSKFNAMVELVKTGMLTHEIADHLGIKEQSVAAEFCRKKVYMTQIRESAGVDIRKRKEKEITPKRKRGRPLADVSEEKLRMMHEMFPDRKNTLAKIARVTGVRYYIVRKIYLGLLESQESTPNLDKGYDKKAESLQKED